MPPTDENQPTVIPMPVNSSAADELQTQREMLQTFLDHAPIMINLLDATGHVKFANRCWEEWLGWTLAEAQTSDIVSVSFPDPAYRAEILEYVAKPTRGWREFRPCRRDGRQLESAWLMMPLSDGSRISLGLEQGQQRAASAAANRIMETLVPRSALWNEPTVSLTKRQREVLQFVAEGKKSKEIAEALNVSVKTVEAHRGQLMAVLKIHDVAGLVRYAIRTGLISA